MGILRKKAKTRIPEERRSSAPSDLSQAFGLPADKGEDHPVIMAQLDLNRSLGVIDRRIDNVMVDPIGTYPAAAVAPCAGNGGAGALTFSVTGLPKAVSLPSAR